jgi:hypothetical protein
VSGRNGSGSSRRTGWHYRSVQGRHIYQHGYEERRLPGPSGSEGLVRRQLCFNFDACCRACCSGSRCRASSGSDRSSARCQDNWRQHRHAGARRWTRSCVGQLFDQCLSLFGDKVLRHHQVGEIYDGGAGQGGRGSSRPWQSMRAVTPGSDSWIAVSLGSVGPRNRGPNRVALQEIPPRNGLALVVERLPGEIPCQRALA